MTVFIWFSQKSCHTPACLSYGADTMCAGKSSGAFKAWSNFIYWHFEADRRPRHFWKVWIAPESGILAKWFEMKIAHLMWCSQTSCHKLAVVSYDVNSTCVGIPNPVESNDESNLFFSDTLGLTLPLLKWLGIHMFWTFSSIRHFDNVQNLEQLSISNVTRSAPKCRKMKFDPPLDAPGSGLSSAHRINNVQQTRELMATFFCGKHDKKLVPKKVDNFMLGQTGFFGMKIWLLLYDQESCTGSFN